MPDGDRFERRLRGKHFKRAYRLLLAGEPPDAITDRLASGIAEEFRTHGPQGLHKVFALTEDACTQRQHGALFEGELLTQLLQGYELIVKEENYSDAAQSATRAGMSAFAESAATNSQAFQEDLLGRYLIDVAHRRFFAVAKEALTERGLTMSALREWQSTVCDSLKEQARTWRNAIFGNERKETIRAPRHRHQPAPFQPEELHKPLG
jgi:hypothetical protein